MGWEESRYITVSMADLVRIPEFLDILNKYPEKDNHLIKVDDRKARLLKESGETVLKRGGEDYWARESVPLSAVKEFLVEKMEANPKKPVVVDFVKHRTIDNQIVTCDRFWSFHKDAKYIDQELFDDLNNMQKTSHIESLQENNS